MNQGDRARVRAIAADLNIPAGRWALAGSGSMVMHGIDRKMRDVDIFCATATWFSLMRQARITPLPPDAGDHSTPSWEVFTTDPDDSMRRCDPPYLYKMMHGIEVNIFSCWRVRGAGDIDMANWIAMANMVDGIPCVPLKLIYAWKAEMGRAKDLDDIQLIKEYMA